jgi:pheromone shutdown protein TraB
MACPDDGALLDKERKGRISPKKFWMRNVILLVVISIYVWQQVAMLQKEILFRWALSCGSLSILVQKTRRGM